MSAHPEEFYFTHQNPLGLFRIYLIGEKISRVQLRAKETQALPLPNSKIPDTYQQFLDAYCSGQPVRAQNDWLHPAATPFAQQIYHALIQVPFGQVISYGALAQQAGYTSGHARAVGQIMNNNPWPLFVPCHRVIGAGNRLGGFGVGLELKMAMLKHEGVCLSSEPNQAIEFHTTLERVTHAF